MKQRILFVAENVTLAQVVRLVVLARSLDPAQYEVHFASSGFDPLIFSELDFEQHSLVTMSKQAVDRAVTGGRRIYDKATLFRYVRADLDVIERVRPHFIVGDFRLSLNISAPVSRVPHASLINAYWSPYRSQSDIPVPDHPIIRLLGEELTAQYFPKAQPWVFEHFAAPVNAVRRRYGLPKLGDLRQVLCHGDYTLYADIPELVPTAGAPPEHVYVGPILWSPNVSCAPELLAPRTKPLVYVTLGSSGNLEVLPCVLEALAKLPVDAVVATANRAQLGQLPANVVAYPFVPGEEISRRAALVISNGGSTTGYQALSQGTPVLGIASNLDQYLAMQAMSAYGAAILVKARNASSQQIERGVQDLLHKPDYRNKAAVLAKEFQRYPAHQRFPAFLERALWVHAQRSPSRLG